MLLSTALFQGKEERNAMSDSPNAPGAAHLRIDPLPLPGGGVLGMTHCPGRRQAGQADSRAWTRDLRSDLEFIRTWQASMLLSLVEAREFKRLGVADLAVEARRAGLVWRHLPIRDMHPPDARFERSWETHADEIEALLKSDGRLVLHCAGGLGRTGTVAARLLIDRGFSASRAIEAVRAARPGAIETASQEAYLQEYGRKGSCPVAG